MPVHAFIDESVRDQRYLLCMTLVAPAQLAPSRRELSSLLLPGARELHFKKEKEPPPQATDRPHSRVGSHDDRLPGCLQKALGHRPSKTELTYEHLNSTAEPLLWISDAVGWCFGAGGTWRRRASRLIDSVIEP
ncbi:hypothetical protein [Amycolatopsis sp. TNS106]|uniref:hypothetical protein n=1 Tax=Amycolatopsis sp. TNS106 TaxID=2861750 RepID=UPI002107CE36|nr:hypothetical protein [Amycolatopsis sp. TNS106]